MSEKSYLTVTKRSQNPYFGHKTTIYGHKHQNHGHKTKYRGHKHQNHGHKKRPVGHKKGHKRN